MRPVLTVPGAAVGRRKQAIARVRLVPGSGTITAVSYTHLDVYKRQGLAAHCAAPIPSAMITAVDVKSRVSSSPNSRVAPAVNR